MTDEIILEISNISKQYKLGVVGASTVKDDLNRWWHKIRGKEDPFLKVGSVNNRTISDDASGYVWALQNINIDVKQGDVVGVIGRNGAGKSTLLKLLSRVTSPTTGEIKTKGRIASLLEVGTGFHAELTGRENIFLNGAILGMTKAEITEKIDEIISFSGCERYIDTPVKRYSSGMTVRLAFAVAAFLEPDILVIDEVLAVGDAEFQKKAIGKMQDISSEQGRTVLFVSHNMASVKALCTRGIVLEYGQIVFSGETDAAVSYYLKGDAEFDNYKTFGHDFETDIFKLISISIQNESNEPTAPILEDKALEIVTTINIKTDKPEAYHITYHLNSELGDTLFSFSHLSDGVILKKGHNVLKCSIPESFLQYGQYFLSFYLVKDKRRGIFIEKDIISFTLVNAQREIGTYMGREPGYVRPQFKWHNHNE